MAGAPTLGGNDLASTGVAGVQQPGINISSPFMSDVSNAAKADTQKALKSIFEYGAGIYEKKLEESKRVERILRSSMEDAEAHRYGMEVQQEARQIQNDDEVAPYVKKKFDDYFEKKREQYANGDPLLYASVYDNIQRASLTAEASAFSFAEDRRKKRAIAAADENLFALQSNFVLAPNETVRQQILDSGAKIINEAAATGIMDADDAAALGLKFRSDSYAAVISAAVNDGNLRFAEGYFKEKASMIAQDKQVQLANSIGNERERQEAKALRMQMQAIVQQEKAEKLFLSDPGEFALKYRQADPENPKDMYTKSNGRAVITSMQAKMDATALEALRATPVDFVKFIAEKKQKNGEFFNIYLSNLQEHAKVSPSVGNLVEVANDGIRPSGIIDPKYMKFIDYAATVALKPEESKKFLTSMGETKKSAIDSAFNLRIGKYARTFESNGRSREESMAIIEQARLVAYMTAAMEGAPAESAVDAALAPLDGTYQVAESIGAQKFLIPRAYPGEDISSVKNGLKVILAEQKDALVKAKRITPTEASKIGFANLSYTDGKGNFIITIGENDFFRLPVTGEDGYPIVINADYARLRANKKPEYDSAVKDYEKKYREFEKTHGKSHNSIFYGQ